MSDSLRPHELQHSSSSAHGIFQIGILEWVAIPFSRGSFQPRTPSLRVFSNESTLRMRWPKYWSFSFSAFLPKKSQGWSPLEWTGWISLQSKGLSRVFSNTMATCSNNSCLENSTDRGAWGATVHGVAKSQTQLSTHTFLFFF